MLIEGKEKMEREKKSGKKNLRRVSFSVKIILLVLTSYLVIQLSNEVKRIEEKENISSIQTTLDLVEQYVQDQYLFDWGRLGHILCKGTSYLESYQLSLRTDHKEIEILKFQSSKYDNSKREFWGFTFSVREDYILIYEDFEKNEKLYSIWIAYNGDPHIRFFIMKQQMPNIIPSTILHTKTETM